MNKNPNPHIRWTDLVMQGNLFIWRCGRWWAKLHFTCLDVLQVDEDEDEAEEVEAQQQAM